MPEKRYKVSQYIAKEFSAIPSQLAYRQTMDCIARPMTIPAVNRPFALGMLYNCFDDTLLVSIGPWSKETLDKFCLPLVPTPCNFKVKHKIEDVFSKNDDLLDIGPAMKLSLLSGLVNMEGSAMYLDDMKISQRQERVSFRATYTTSFQRLFNPFRQIDFPDILDYPGATHYVCGITYGANIVLVFDKLRSEEKTSTEPSGDANAIINAFSSVKIGGEVPAQQRADIANASKGFKFKFYGDINLSRYPVTPEDAFDVLQSLSTDNCVPVQIFLEPIDWLRNSTKSNKQEQKIWEISANMTDHVAAVFESLQTLKVACEDLLSSSGCKRFPSLAENIRNFMLVVISQKKTFQRRIQEFLLEIRSTRVSERVLEKYLEEIRSSPVGPYYLRIFLEAKEEQLNILSTVIKHMPKCFHNDTAPVTIDEVACNPQSRYIVSYTVYTVPSATYLNACRWYIKNGRVRDGSWKKHLDSDANVALDSSVMEEAVIFKDYYESNFDMKGSHLKFIITESESGNLTQPATLEASLQLYKGNKLLYPRFSPVTKPGAPFTTEASLYCVDIAWKAATSQSENVLCYEVEYQAQTENSNAVVERTKCSSSKFCIPNLRPGTRYKVRCRGCTKSGRGRWSEQAFVQTSSLIQKVIAFLI